MHTIEASPNPIHETIIAAKNEFEYCYWYNNPTEAQKLIM